MNQKNATLRPALFAVITGMVFVCDQMSKYWAQQHLSIASVPIFGHAFMLTLTHNHGGAWGVMPRGNLFFILFAILAGCALIAAYLRTGRELTPGAAFALALGGALGNLLDRVRLGYVVDFFDIRIIHWPIFNVADTAITLGIALLFAHFMRSSQPAEETAPAKNSAPDAAPASHE